MANAPPIPRYREWLSYLFGREVKDPAWYHSPEARPFSGEPAEIAELFVNTMRHCGSDLAPYCEAQVAQGLQHVINPSCGNVVFALTRKPLSKDQREEVILSLSNLYSDCFTPRCAPFLSHLDEAGANPLNRVCYMFWDVTPLLSGPPGAVLKVLEAGLKSVNPACQESALHGLGHLPRANGKGKRVEEIIVSYLRSRRPSTALRAYAERAARGAIA
jgi:hypothetical protein